MVAVLGGTGRTGRTGRRAVQVSGPEWTVLRGDWSHRNPSEGSLPGPVRAGVLPLAVGGAVKPFRDAGFVAHLPGGFADLSALPLDGRDAAVTGGVERALGRPARDVADHAREAAATGVRAVLPSGARA
ncbi:hypothetical protein [Kineococcus indalonis]|uniref:hypothetical protein n=1 Tax=Kineococcus indalonis TaxID=2696566 RepID=UPI0014125469|nr:hypothetical protein [Kineococcus indalonis]NAZ87081.1 hypothetical protein [Kineococcus indalonis]